MSKSLQSPPQEDVEGGCAVESEGVLQQPEDRQLRVELEIDRGGYCPTDDIEEDIVSLDVRFQGGRCMAEAEVRTCEDQSATTNKQFSAEVCEHCPGVIFARYGCIPRFLKVKDESFVVETYLKNAERLSDLVNDIRDRCARATVLSITSTSDSGIVESCSVDLSALTPKQREAVTIAQEEDHYDPDGSESLASIADRIGISESALSQRLQRAEANILNQLDCECSCWQDP